MGSSGHRVIDKTCLTVDDGALKKMTALSYSKPKPEVLEGTQAIRSINKWLMPSRGGLKLSGGKDDLGFLFLYELFTAGVRLAVLPQGMFIKYFSLYFSLYSVDVQCEVFAILTFTAGVNASPCSPKTRATTGRRCCVVCSPTRTPRKAQVGV